MLNYIFSRLLVVLELCSRTQRRLEAIETILKQHTGLLQEIRDQLIPEPAVSLKIQAGPVEEQK